MECHKICYSLKDAKTELNRVKKIGKKYRREIRYYPCPICKDCYHLTSEQEYNERIYLKEENLIFKSKWDELKNP